MLHGAAYDAVGSSDVGVSASIGLDPDLVLHMDDFTESLRNIQEILLSQVKTEPTAENRRKATEMLRSSPGVIALIRAGDYKFEDFTTDGAIDIAKLTAARAGTTLGHLTVYLSNEDLEPLNLLADRWSAQLILSF